DFDRLNVNGSGISLGHPVGATGGRILATMLREMDRRQARYGLETMCIGGGQGIAAVFERVCVPPRSVFTAEECRNPARNHTFFCRQMCLPGSAWRAAGPCMMPQALSAAGPRVSQARACPRLVSAAGLGLPQAHACHRAVRVTGLCR